MFAFTKSVIAIISGLAFLWMIGCGGTPGSITEDELSSSQIAVNATDSTTSEAVPPPGGNALGDFDFVLAPAAVTSGSVTIECRDSDGNITRITKELNAEGSVTLGGVPANEQCITYLNNADGSTRATGPVSNTSALGGINDPWTIKGGKIISSDLTLNGNTETSAQNCSTSDCETPSSGGLNAPDVTGTYTITCNDVIVKSTGASSGDACPGSLNGTSVYLHRIQMTDQGGETRFAIGAWPSQGAFTTCGSTEGVTDLPTGWSMVTEGQTADFGWDAPYANFSSNTSDAEIRQMIGAESGYAAYRTDNCANFGQGRCESLYYWSSLFDNTSTTCTPMFNIAFASDGTATFSPKSSFAGRTRPMQRHALMGCFVFGDKTYCKSEQSFTIPAFRSSDSTVFDCYLTDQILVSINTPAATPVVGDTLTISFEQTTNVVSSTGTSGDNTACTQQVGADSELSPKGTVTITSWEKTAN